jgi:aminopeptidase-like protein
VKQQIEQYFDRLWPLNRSLTGNGNRETFKILSEIIDLKISEIPSGTQCFDWTIPPEWNVKEAWVKDDKGNIVIDLANNNLHLLGYSEPFKGKISFEELAPHIHTLPDQPDLIPYLTSYYQRRWGFCMPHNQFLNLDKKAFYDVYIDSTLDENGSMTIADALVKGSSDKEILLSTYICHPSLASNELSGNLVAAFIYSKLKKKKNLKYTYRFTFVPETIGTIYYLWNLGSHFKRKLEAGFVITCVGDNGKFTYKKSRQGNALADRATELILKQSEKNYNILDFCPRGGDERQYCSPGFNLPVGSLMRTMYGTYPEYHTSADNKEYISFEAMEKSVERYLDVIELLEANERYINTLPCCEPQLSKRGLYPTLGSQKNVEKFVDAMMWVLNLADGTNDLISISQKSKVSVKELFPIVNTLKEKGLLELDLNLEN